MTIQRKSVVDQLEISRTGDVGVRIALQVVDGEHLISSNWHRCAIPLSLPARFIMEQVNDHIASTGNPPVSEDDISYIEKFQNLCRSEAPPETPEE